MTKRGLIETVTVRKMARGESSTHPFEQLKLPHVTLDPVRLPGELLHPSNEE
jgi:hypothetical protein